VLIKQIHIRDLRIIEVLDLHPEPGINLLFGGNGAGKTTLLEAIHLLGNGRSFRHSDAGPLIREGATHSLVTARLVDSRGLETHLGVRREKRQFSARREGKDIRRRSELLRQLPLQLLLPTSHELVEKGPELRRRFLDQGLFHVEQSYHQLMLDYGRALRQRNAAARRGDRETMRSFNGFLSMKGEQLTHFRREFASEVEGVISTLLPELKMQVASGIRLHFQKGWRESEVLEEALKRAEPTDLKLGYTTVGPHRSEMRLLVAGRKPAAKTLSRGQQKLLVYALILAHVEIIRKKGLEKPVLLADDLDAELDAERVSALVQYLKGTALQVFVTTLNGPLYRNLGLDMFHVEQGSVKRAP
jgi:DNA replication and repair protein RecF